MSRFEKRETTVIDTQHKLEWSHTLNNGKGVNHAKAEKLCKALGEGWRLPTVEELFLLADRARVSPAIDTEFFPDTKSDWYWSSSPYAANSDCAWIVLFGNGSSYWSLRDGRYCVRAVRASQ